LKALKFQNRTEAAVFAARQSETIRTIAQDRAQPAGNDVTGEDETPPPTGRGLTAH